MHHNLNSLIYDCPTATGFERIAFVKLKEQELISGGLESCSEYDYPQLVIQQRDFLLQRNMPPHTMEAIQFDKKKVEILLIKAPLPTEPVKNEVIVQVAFAGICGTDLHIAEV